MKKSCKKMKKSIVSSNIIYPQSKLPYDSMTHPNFLKCWALENLQPLEAKENISKGNRLYEREAA